MPNRKKKNKKNKNRNDRSTKTVQIPNEDIKIEQNTISIPMKYLPVLGEIKVELSNGLKMRLIDLAGGRIEFWGEGPPLTPEEFEKRVTRKEE